MNLATHLSSSRISRANRSAREVQTARREPTFEVLIASELNLSLYVIKEEHSLSFSYLLNIRMLVFWSSCHHVWLNSLKYYVIVPSKCLQNQIIFLNLNFKFKSWGFVGFGVVLTFFTLGCSLWKYSFCWTFWIFSGIVKKFNLKIIRWSESR